MAITQKIVPRGRPRAFDRDVALERAMEVFWAVGFESASIPALTEAMGISAQSLYAAFQSKEALYREAVARYGATLGGFARRALDEEPDVIHAMARVLRDAVVTFTDNPDTPGCMIIAAPAGTLPHPLAQFGQQLRDQALHHVEMRLARGVAEGQIRSDVDCTARARYISSVVQGLSVQARDAASTTTLLATAQIAIGSLQALRS